MRAALATVGAVLLAAGAAFAGDAEIKQRIEERLAKAGLDKRTEISVSVEGGVARLGGIALRYADLREADRAARKEARSVVNELRVVPESPRSDKAILTDAQGEILGWARYGVFDAVAVDVQDGVVSLRGWVDSPYKKEEIEDHLAQLDGLRDVHNDLRVQGFSNSDRELRREVFLRIYRDPMFERWADLPDPPVRVFVDKGRVTLAGSVGSAVEKQVAGDIARGTLAFSVNNQVVVESERPSEDRKKDDAS
jgi:hyperosmotically inducible periplasmic protein